MSLNAKEVQNNSGPKQEPLEAGSYPARLLNIIDLGTQEQRPYQGKEKDPIQEIHTTYEILDEYMVDEDGNEDMERPRVVGETMPFHSLDADRAKSTQRYYAMDPNDEHDGDWTKLIGVPVMITITKTEGKHKNKGKFYNNIAGVSLMREKDAKKARELINDAKVFTLGDPDVETFMSLYGWLQKEIKKSPEFEESGLAEMVKNFEKEEKKKEKEKPQEDDNQEDDVADEEDTDEEW